MDLLGANAPGVVIAAHPCAGQFGLPNCDRVWLCHYQVALEIARCHATITGTSATIILRWNSAYGTTTRNFLVSVSYNSGAVVGLVAFTNGSADDMVDFSAMTDRNDL